VSGKVSHSQLNSRLPDLDVLEDGDMTEIGAKGVSLRHVPVSSLMIVRLTLPVAVRKLVSLWPVLSTRIPDMFFWTTRSLLSILTPPSI
jgi:hypothetical protein